MAQKQKEKRERPACADPASDQYGKHRWVFWGADGRFARCRWCGRAEASHISDEARYAKVPIVDRPLHHGHTFEPYPFDRRFERCACGASRKAQQAEKARDKAGAA